MVKSKTASIFAFKKQIQLLPIPLLYNLGMSSQFRLSWEVCRMQETLSSTGRECVCQGCRLCGPKIYWQNHNLVRQMVRCLHHRSVQAVCVPDWELDCCRAHLQGCGRLYQEVDSSLQGCPSGFYLSLHSEVQGCHPVWTRCCCCLGPERSQGQSLERWDCMDHKAQAWRKIEDSLVLVLELSDF